MVVIKDVLCVTGSQIHSGIPKIGWESFGFESQIVVDLFSCFKHCTTQTVGLAAVTLQGFALNGEMTTAVLFSDQTQLHCRGCRQFSDYTAPPPKNPLNFSKSPRPIVTFYLSIFYWNIHLFDLDFYVIWNAIQSLFFF